MKKRVYKVLSVVLALALVIGTLGFGGVKAEASEDSSTSTIPTTDYTTDKDEWGHIWCKVTVNVINEKKEPIKDAKVTFTIIDYMILGYGEKQYTVKSDDNGIATLYVHGNYNELSKIEIEADGYDKKTDEQTYYFWQWVWFFHYFKSSMSFVADMGEANIAPSGDDTNPNSETRLLQPLFVVKNSDKSISVTKDAIAITSLDSSLKNDSTDDEVKRIIDAADTEENASLTEDKLDALGIQIPELSADEYSKLGVVDTTKATKINWTKVSLCTKEMSGTDGCSEAYYIKVEGELEVEEEQNTQPTELSLTVKYFVPTTEENGLCSGWTEIATSTVTGSAFDSATSFSAKFNKIVYSEEQGGSFVATEKIYVEGSGDNKGKLTYTELDSVGGDSHMTTFVSEETDYINFEITKEHWEKDLNGNSNLIFYVECKKDMIPVTLCYVIESGDNKYFADEQINVWPGLSVLDVESEVYGDEVETALASQGAILYSSLKIDGSNRTDWTKIGENRPEESGNSYVLENGAWVIGREPAYPDVDYMYVYGTPIMPVPTSEPEPTREPSIINFDLIINNEEKEEETTTPTPTPEVVVELEEEETPKGDVEVEEEEETPEETETVELEEEETPQGDVDLDIDDFETPKGDVDLPQTGTLAVGVVYGIGAACVALGGTIAIKARRKED